MATTIAAGYLARGGGVVTTSSGNIYVFWADTSYIYAYKSTDGGSSFSSVASAESVNIHGSGSNIGSIDIAIDSDGYIHVASNARNTDTRDTAYCLFNTSNDTFGTWEEAAAGSKYVANTGVSISIDSNKKPHILFVIVEANMGTDYHRIYYTNKVSGSWATPTMISTGTTKSYYYPGFTVRNSNYLEAVYGDANPMYFYRTYTTSWETENYWADTAYSRGIRSITAKSDGTVYRYGRDFNSPQNVEENDSQLGVADAYTGADPSYGANLTGSTRYLFRVDNTDRDIYVYINSGTGWNQSVLETGTYYRIITEWAYNFEYQSNRINYIFDDNTNIYFNYYSLAQPKSLVSNPQSRKTYLRM